MGETERDRKTETGRETKVQREKSERKRECELDVCQKEINEWIDYSVSWSELGA